MDHIGIDVHKKESQICILAEEGELSEERIRTDPERFAAVLGQRPRARILLEASTDSEWVARCLEGLGHEVIFADPTFVPTYATRTRKVKTDRRDARALADAGLLGAYHQAHRLSDPQRHVRGRPRQADRRRRARPPLGRYPLCAAPGWDRVRGPPRSASSGPGRHARVRAWTVGR